MNVLIVALMVVLVLMLVRIAWLLRRLGAELEHICANTGGQGVAPARRQPRRRRQRVPGQ